MTYYMDTIDGDDAKDGTSEANAVKTMTRALVLATGGSDVILQQIGDENPCWSAVYRRNWDNV